MSDLFVRRPIQPPAVMKDRHVFLASETLPPLGCPVAVRLPGQLSARAAKLVACDEFLTWETTCGTRLVAEPKLWATPGHVQFLLGNLTDTCANCPAWKFGKLT